MKIARSRLFREETDALASEEIPDWEELTDEERQAYRAALRDLGMAFPEGDDPDEDDYCE